MVINDKLANQQDINKVYSVKDAYNYILTADTAHYRPDILRQCSLNEYLFPNLTYDEQRTETAKKEMLDNYSWAAARLSARRHTTSLRVYGKNPSNAVSPSGKNG